MLLLSGFWFCFLSPILCLQPFDITVEITVLNSPCATKCFIRPLELIQIEPDTSCKSGDAEISSCLTNKYCKRCLCGLTSISFSLRSVKLQGYALRLRISFWDFSESK